MGRASSFSLAPTPAALTALDWMGSASLGAPEHFPGPSPGYPVSALACVSKPSLPVVVSSPNPSRVPPEVSPDIEDLLSPFQGPRQISQGQGGSGWWERAPSALTGAAISSAHLKKF